MEIETPISRNAVSPRRMVVSYALLFLIAFPLSCTRTETPAPSAPTEAIESQPDEKKESVVPPDAKRKAPRKSTVPKKKSKPDKKKRKRVRSI